LTQRLPLCCRKT